MSISIDIIMPAHRAETTIPGAIESVLAQTHPDWRLWVIADDLCDYEAVLGRSGIADRRIAFLSTGAVAAGSTVARNIGLDAANGDFAAVLDADDAFQPEKLARVAEALRSHALVSTALQVIDADGRPLREVGSGPDRDLGPGDYKFTNISMDTMIAWDRRAADPRCDPAQPCLTDLDLLLKIFANVATCRHLGTPLHRYVKQPVSISNGPGTSARMVEMKKIMIARLENGHYPLDDPDGTRGVADFLARSLRAETTYDAAKARDPDLLFEDHLEPYLQ